jgi:hypothetical protein
MSVDDFKAEVKKWLDTARQSDFRHQVLNLATCILAAIRVVEWQIFWRRRSF